MQRTTLMSHARRRTCGGSSTSSRAPRALPSLRAAAAAERNLVQRKVKSIRPPRCRRRKMENCAHRRLRCQRFRGITIWWPFTRYRSCRISTSSSLFLTSLRPYYVSLFCYSYLRFSCHITLIC